MVILFLILIMGSVTVMHRHENEIRLIQRGFVELQKNGRQLISRIDVWYKIKSLKQNSTNDTLETELLEYDTILSDSIFDKNSFPVFLDRSFFNEYIVWGELYDTANDMLKDIPDFLYRSFSTDILNESNYLKYLQDNLYLPPRYNIFKNKEDSALKQSYLNTGFISKTTINYSKYYQFVYPLKIGHSKIYISGLISNEDYLEKKRHIEDWILIFIGISLIFTLFTFPFLKLFQLSKTEGIKTSDAVLLHLTVSAFACIITVLILNSIAIYNLKEETKAQLKSLNASLRSCFIDELNLMYDVVEAYEKTKKTSSAPINHILTDSGVKSSNADLLHIIRNYPYFKSLFYSEEDTVLEKVTNSNNSDSIRIRKRKTISSSHIFTTWNTDTNSIISYREYFKNKDEWLMPGEGDEKRFRLESIYSNTSGDALAVLAKPSNKHKDTVYCISSPMHSIINTVLPPGFEFRIIDKSGKVWFHNDKRNNTIENFLDECDHNDEILGSMNNRVEASIPLKISLRNYQAHISPVSNLPLFLVVLSTTQEQNEFISRINYILVIFILVGVFFGLLTIMLIHFEKYCQVDKHNHIDNREPILGRFFPDSRKNSRYWILLFLNALLGLFMAVQFLFKAITIVHFLLILISSFSVCSIYTHLLINTNNKKTYIKLIPIAFSILIVVCNIVYSVSLPGYGWFLLFETLAILFIVIIVHDTFNLNLLVESLSKKLKNQRIQAVINWAKRDPYLPYVLFLYSWMAITCILPILILFKISKLEEVELLTKKNQVELASRLERKNLQIDSFYIARIYPKDNAIDKSFLDSIKMNLKHRGNYLANSFNMRIIENVDKRVTPYEIPYETPGSGFVQLNKFLRKKLNSEDIRCLQMFYNIGLDSMWFWPGGYSAHARSDTLSLYYTSKQKDDKAFFSAYQLEIISNLELQKTNPKHKYYIVEVAVFLLFLIFLFFLIWFMLRKVFILEKDEIPNKHQFC